LKIESGRPGFAAERVMPAALAREFVEALRPECEARGCALTMHVSGTADAELPLDRANFERVVQLLLGLQMVRWSGRPLDVALDMGESGPGFYRLALSIEAMTMPSQDAPSGNDTVRAGALAEAGGDLALILCRRYVESMHGTLQYAGGAAAPTRVAIELLLPAY